MNWPCWKGVEQSTGSGHLMTGNLGPHLIEEGPQPGLMVTWWWLAEADSSLLPPGGGHVACPLFLSRDFVFYLLLV